MTNKTAFLKLARERFDQGKTSDKKQRERELADLRFYAGDQWDSDVLESRKGQDIGSGTTQQVVPARPSLTINKTREPVRQVLNQERQSDLGIELIPADDFGEMGGPIDHTEIELREGLCRRIQRDSEAADARTWAFARATIAGRGYYLVMTRFVPGKSWDQEVYVDRIYNQASVLLDPAHEQADGSDAEWGFYGTDLAWDVYKSEFPSTKDKHNRVSAMTGDSSDEWRALGDEAPGWFTTEGDTRFVRVMNYYYTDRKSRELALLEDGSVQWADELQPGVTAKETRTVVQKSIKWAKIDGVNVLDETDWPGHYIPIIKVVGEELQPYDKERRCEGIVRPMIDPCKANNYIISKFVERSGLSPLSPWMMAAGQDEGYEDEYNAANTRALSRLHYNAVDSFGKPVPPPFRVDARTEIADIAMGVQIFGQAIESTSLVPVPALGHTDPTVTSGKHAKALIAQAEHATSNFLDNLVRSMRHEARVINDLLYPIYGIRPGRLARMMNPQGEMSAVLIGQPFAMQGQGPQAKPVPVQQGQPQDGAKQYQLTKDAEFNVAVKISKNFDTRRQQEASMVAEIIGADPSQLAIIGDLYFKNLDGPGHEEMSERYKAVLAPPIQALLQGQGQSLAEAQSKIAQLEQQLQEVMPLADKNKADLQKTDMQEQAESQRKQATEQAENERTLAKVASDERIAVQKLDLERRKLEVELEIEMAKLGSAQSMARAELEQQELHAHSEQALRREEMQASQAQATLDRQAAQDAAAMKASTQSQSGAPA